jgi:hypothetical protein
MSTFETNPFSLDYYASAIKGAMLAGYNVVTLEEFWDLSCPTAKTLVLRHDVDVKPHTLKKVLDVERALNCRSSLYVRVAGAPYNFLDYPVFKVLQDAASDGFMIGLHTNYVEFASINNLNPLCVLVRETEALSAFFPGVRSLAPHRDHNYVCNSLPHLEINWVEITDQLQQYAFQAYDRRITDAVEYVNEGLIPHLTWRNKTPEEVVTTGKSFVMMTHSHWWYKIHPFEE